MNMKLASKIWTILTALCLTMAMVACSEKEDKPEPSTPDTPVVPVEPDKPKIPTLGEDEASASLAELMSRCMMAAIDPDAKCNDAERLWELIRTVYYQPQTRGVWSTAVGLVKFKQAINNANALYRATLLGAMIETGQIGPEARQQIWRIIMAAPAYGSQNLPDSYRVGCEDFWTSFSRGEFDDAAVFIYTAVISERRSSTSTPAEQVANYLDEHDLYEIKMMLRCAGPIIEQGCNIVFASGDDLISWGQTAYDFVNNNGNVVLEVCKGNLSAETCLDAINSNLKLLTNGLKDVLPDGTDLAGVLSDFTTAQVKEFNKAVQEALNTAGATKLSPDDVTWFVTQVQDIMGVSNPQAFVDEVFFNDNDMTQLSIESRDGHAYQFFYTDRHGNVLMEGKCSVNSKTISLLVDEDNTDAHCDLLPSSGIPANGIVVIPYHMVNAATLVLWYNSSNPRQKYFSIMNDEDSEDLFDQITLGLWVTGGKEGTSTSEVLRATRSNGAVFDKDDISTSFYGDGLWVRALKDFEMSDGTTLRHKIEFLLENNDIINLSNARRFSYSCWEIDRQGHKTSYWTMYSPEVPLTENSRSKVVWFVEGQNMNVSHLNYRDNKRTICDTYLASGGDNRIEINVSKGETPQQLFVSPKELSFNTEASQQTITVKRGAYRFFGCNIDGSEADWLSTSLDTDSTINVKVTANSTGKERKATIMVWAANKSDFKEVDQDNELFETIKINLVQKGRAMEPRVTKVSLGGIEFNPLPFEDYETESKNSFGFPIHKKGVVKTEKVGKGLRITAIAESVTETHTKPDVTINEITIVIPDCTGDKFSDISELHFRRTSKMDYPLWGDTYEYFTQYTDITVRNITVTRTWMGSSTNPNDNRVLGNWESYYPNFTLVSYERDYVSHDSGNPELLHESGKTLTEKDNVSVSIEGVDLIFDAE